MRAASGAVNGGPRTPRLALRPLAVPNEHGGWGFLFEPLVLGLALVPSAGGLLVALAFVLAFFTRQPLRFALQDLVRGRSYPRTRACWTIAGLFAGAAVLALAGAVRVAGPALLVPLLAASPLGLVLLAFDAKNRSRALVPELGGAAAMSSSAAAIALAGGMGAAGAAALSAIVLARFVPSIVYVRTLLRRAHGETARSWPALVLHVAAAAGAAVFAPPLAGVAMAVLLARAAWQLHRPVPSAKRIGWSEIAFGALTVVLVAFGW